MTVLDRFRLEGRIAVVTGGGKGIGRGIAIALAEAGADVMIAARTAADLDATAELIRATGRRAATCPIDLLSPDANVRLAEQTMVAFGGIDIWVNNAGGLPDATPRYLSRTSEAEWDAQIDLNLKAVWLGCLAAARHMKAGGAIINLSSRAAFGGHAKNGPYSAAKAAVNSLTSTLAVELAPAIRVNAVAPGPVVTQNLIESIGVAPENVDGLASQFAIPLKRMGKPEDIGAAVVFFASHASDWITGQCLYVTGGF